MVCLHIAVLHLGGTAILELLLLIYHTYSKRALIFLVKQASQFQEMGDHPSCYFFLGQNRSSK